MNLDDIKFKIQEINRDSQKAIITLENEAFDLFVKSMESKKDIIQSMINALDVSKDLTTLEHDDWLHTYTIVDFSKLINVKDDLEKELLKRYFDEYHYSNCEIKYSTLTRNIGPSLIVSKETGTVYDQDSQKIILTRDEYFTRQERNEKIEQWMEKSRYYPAVIMVDNYGNAQFINTKN